MKSQKSAASRMNSITFRLILLLIVLQTLSSGCSIRQRHFSTPEEAADALVLAAQSEDKDEVKRILGRGADDVVSSGDEVADRRGKEKFLKAYEEKHALVAETDGSMTLQVGAEDYPLPIAIVKQWGSWRFDTARGKDEILNRRIGRNELDVMQVCLALVDAQREYVSVDRNGDGVPEYAQKLISDPGEKNGLYWETGGDEPPSPIGPLVADAVEEGYAGGKSDSTGRRPYHGYYFMLLRSQGPRAAGGAHDYVVNGRMTGGFAVVAWPAEYGNSGVMTFLVNQYGVVFQRDLGRATDQIAKSMLAFDPDESWRVVE